MYCALINIIQSARIRDDSDLIAETRQEVRQNGGTTITSSRSRSNAFAPSPQRALPVMVMRSSKCCHAVRRKTLSCHAQSQSPLLAVLSQSSTPTSRELLRHHHLSAPFWLPYPDEQLGWVRRRLCNVMPAMPGRSHAFLNSLGAYLRCPVPRTCKPDPAAPHPPFLFRMSTGALLAWFGARCA